MWFSASFSLALHFFLSFSLHFGLGFFIPFCPDNCHFPNGFIKYKNLPQSAKTFYTRAQLTNGVHKVHRCHRGFNLKGPATSVCVNGEWSNKLPRCVPVGCERLQPTVNNYQSVQYSNDQRSDGNYRYGTVVQVYCQRGTSLVEGDGSATCTAGQWMPSIPFCLTRETLTADADPMNADPLCQDNRNFANGFIKYKNLPQSAKTFSTRAQLTNGVHKLHRCHRGFILKGTTTSVCVNGEWSHKVPRCVPVGCDRLQPTVNNYRSVQYSNEQRSDETYRHNTVVQVYCQRGTSMVEGDGSATCTAGQWMPSIPFCLTRETLTADADPMNADNECRLPSLMSGTYMYLNDAGDAVLDGAEIEYECFPFAERTTDIPVQCYRGEWYPDSPMCIEKSCEIPSLPPFVLITNDLSDPNKLAHGLHLQFECENGYRKVRGDDEIACQYGEWNGDIPKCELDSSQDFSRCGESGDISQPVRGRVIGGFDARNAAWPWMAVVQWQRNDGSWFFFCGGTLVGQNWVLSAGHCFGYDEDIARLQIKLGLTHRYKDSDTYKEQIFNIDGLYLPKQHDFINFDYDIALLHLAEPVTFNTFVRPVCLPSVPGPDDDVDALIEVDEFAMVLGWGHSSPVPANSSRGSDFKDRLQQLEMPLRTDLTCINSLISIGEAPDQFTPHMFCAGYNRKQKDACFGDSGGPLMRRILPPGPGRADWRWIQIGIVSSGKGCAVKGQFAFYTHLSKLMWWVESVMKGNHTASEHDMYLV